jgi:DNA-binding NarL/FixJ family response regulator
MKVRVLLADDHRLMRAGLRGLLVAEADFDVVGEADDGRRAVALARDLSPDVVVMDVGMPDLNGIEATRQILAERPATRVVALSMHTDRRFVGEMMRAGAVAYLAKDCAYEELVTAIRAVTAGEVYLGRTVSTDVIRDWIRGLPEGPPTPGGRLTAREREILQMVAEGKSTKEVAFELGVSVKTVETHRQQVMEKLGLRSVAELTKYAIREGLTSVES